MTALALEAGEALTATRALHALSLTLSAAPVLEALGLALATVALHALSLSVSAATLHLERALATAATFGALSLALPASASAALGLLPTATLLFGLRLATIAATALVRLCRGGRGNRKCRHAGYENELPHLESPFISK
jgi:hypothetical protein